MAKSVKCPKCKSVDISPITEDKKHSLLKTVAGGAVFGLAGAAVGFASGKKEVTFRCNECGRVFSVKL